MTSVSVCLATMQRPSVAETLRSIDRQRGLDGVRVEIVVADNDDTPSARPLIEAVASTLKTPVRYLHAPARNISIARNATLDAASGDWVAFIDDDEVAADTWLAELLKVARPDTAPAVIGPAIAVYPPGAPRWMRDQDHHSNRPVWRGGRIETGHTCNALVHVADPRIAGERFRLDKGRSGGEDTEFFFRLHRKGVPIAAAPAAEVFEDVAPSRLSYAWIARRKFRAGQTYGFHSAQDAGPAARARLFASAVGKVAFCFAVAGALAPWAGRRRFWTLRGRMHAGVAAATLGRREGELYG